MLPGLPKSLIAFMTRYPELRRLGKVGPGPAAGTARQAELSTLWRKAGRFTTGRRRPSRIWSRHAARALRQMSSLLELWRTGRPRDLEPSSPTCRTDQRRRVDRAPLPVAGLRGPAGGALAACRLTRCRRSGASSRSKSTRSPSHTLKDVHPVRSAAKTVRPWAGARCRSCSAANAARSYTNARTVRPSATSALSGRAPAAQA